jgi:CheY-like chemotaxis protein
MSTESSGSGRAGAPAVTAPATRDAYLARVRHDLRTPINHILGYCEMLLDEAPSAGWPNLVADLEKIATAGKQLLAIVNYHFDASQARPTVPDLRQIQHEVRTPLNHITGYTEILQEQAAEGGHAVVQSDLGKIRSAAQVLLDLLEAHLIHHQYEKDVASGAVQSMWPVGSVPAPPALDFATPPQWQNATILAVDDDPLNLEMIERRLRRQGCTVITAASGPQALEIARARMPDLILLDMIMPGMDGLQVLASLRAAPALARIPVIVLSASDEAGTAVHCIKMGADDFLPKPCSTTLLLARLESSLAKKRLRELRLGEAGYFHDKGTLRPDAPSYIERQADRDLLDGLLAGEPCYVLTSRQMGKSSLMVRSAHRLRECGVSVVVLDLTAIGQNVTAEQWYDGVLTRIARALRLEDEMEEFWLRHSRLSPVQRLFTCLRDIGLRQHGHPLVIFIDELDAVRSLPFSSDEFFGAIRECFNRRAEDPILNRLTFCLLGVADPGDLVRDAQATPFNIARRIELTDFAPDEIRLLAKGLGREPAVAEVLIRRIEHWTRGHPYLTQRICGAIAQDSSVTQPSHVDRLCRDLFFGVKSREDDDNLAFVRRWLLSPQVETRALLEFYECVRRRGGRVAPDEQDPLLRVLRLSGVVRMEGKRLYVRNRIYARAFDSRWVGAHLAPPGTQVEES